MAAGASLPRVLIVGNFLAEQTGVHNVCYELRDQLKAHGHDVLWTSRRLSRVHRLADMLWTTWARRHAYDVAQVDVFSGPAFRWAEAVSKLLGRLGKPMVLTLHGGALPEFAAKQSKRVRTVLERAAVVTSPSEYLQRAMLPYRSEIEVVPNPVDATRFPFRQRPIRGPRILWLRSFHRIYDPEAAVHVLARVRRTQPKATLTMVGGDRDDSRDAVRALATRLGLEDAVIMPGSVPHASVPRILDTHDVFLNTSRIDNAPVSLVEALACGLPVVTTDPGGIRDLVADGATARVAAVGDTEGLARAVLEVVEDPELARALGSAGRAEVERRWSWDALLPRWADLLTLAAARP